MELRSTTTVATEAEATATRSQLTTLAPFSISVRHLSTATAVADTAVATEVVTTVVDVPVAAVAAGNSYVTGLVCFVQLQARLIQSE